MSRVSRALPEALRRVALLLGSVVLFLAAGEAACRLRYGGELHFSGWGPAYARWFSQVHLDPLGLRCPEPACPVPVPDPEAYTLLVLGDSVAFGSGVAYDDIFARRLERLLEARGDPVRYRVINASAPGLDTEMERRLLDQVAPQVHPDLVLLVHFPNDALSEDDPRVRQVAAHLLGEIAGGWLYQRSYFYYFIESRWRRLEERRERRPSYEALVQQAYAPGTPGLARHAQALDDLIRTVELNQRKIAIVLFPMLYRLDEDPFRGAAEVVRGVAARWPVPVIDLLPIFARFEADRITLSPYDRHPNAEGHRIAAEAILAGLARERLIPPPERDAPGPSAR